MILIFILPYWFSIIPFLLFHPYIVRVIIYTHIVGIFLNHPYPTFAFSFSTILTFLSILFFLYTGLFLFTLYWDIFITQATQTLLYLLPFLLSQFHPPFGFCFYPILIIPIPFYYFSSFFELHFLL